MPRLFVGNFDFEHRLADARRVLPAHIARLNAELATAWLPHADDGDFLWTPGEIPVDFWERMTAAGLPRVQSVRDWTCFEGAVELVPWGWTDELFAHARLHGWQMAAPNPVVVRQLNSRRWSAEREAAWSVGLDFAAVCPSVDDVQAAIQRLPTQSPRWVLKAEFGMSGRERCVGEGPLTASAIGWTQRRLGRDGVLFFEPWVESLAEVGVLWDVLPLLPPRLIGVAPMLIGDGGHYRGSQFAPLCEAGWWKDAVHATERAAVDAQQAGYHGPLGIDVMQYRDHDGTSRVRPLQDVNARWTMGRLALAWRRHFPRATYGACLHGPANAAQWLDAAQSNTATALRTNPEIIEGQPVQHAMTLVVDAAPVAP
jgi:hypothetical protein